MEYQVFFGFLETIIFEVTWISENYKLINVGILIKVHRKKRKSERKKNTEKQQTTSW